MASLEQPVGRIEQLAVAMAGPPAFLGVVLFGIFYDLHASGGRQVELLPPFIQGWYLMTDAGLDHAERNLVMTALGGDFSPQRVAQELRNQFPETEVRRRDQGRRFQGFLGDIPEDSDEDLEVLGNTTAELLEEGLTAEAALIVDAETQAQEALAVLHQARRTLKDARQRQHQVKQSRKYYTSGNAARSAAGSSTTPARDDSQLDCLRCGSGDIEPPTAPTSRSQPRRRERGQQKEENLSRRPLSATRPQAKPRAPSLVLRKPGKP